MERNCSGICMDKKKDRTMMMEKKVTIEAKDHVIPAILCIPEKNVKGAVVMLHGTGSQKNEVGNGYQTAAGILAEKYQLASIRFDFCGCGDSNGRHRDFNFTVAIEETLLAREYLKDQLKENVKIGIMGWSQGGTLAMLAAARYPELFSCIVTWAGATTLKNVILTDALYEEAKRNEYFVMQFPWRNPLEFGLSWCKDVRNTDVLKEISRYQGPVLAIAGTEDTIVPAENAKEIVRASSNQFSEAYLIEGMDHTFHVFAEPELKSLKIAIDKTGRFFDEYLKISS